MKQDYETVNAGAGGGGGVGGGNQAIQNNENTNGGSNRYQNAGGPTETYDVPVGG
jgi:hypothetical protein